MKATAADSRGFDEVDEDVSEDESLEFDDSEDGAEEGEEDDEEDEEALDGEEAEDLFGSEDEVEVPLPDEAVAVAQGGERGRAKKRKLKSLPLFASADEWATMLGRSDDDE